VHDSRAGLRINAKCQVMDMNGQAIPGLYCGGESAGGFNQHCLGRCTTQGYIAGKHAAAETSEEKEGLTARKTSTFETSPIKQNAEDSKQPCSDFPVRKPCYLS